MSRRLRRILVVIGVVLSLFAGIISVRIAAELTLAAAPPPAPPISMSTLQSRLAEEQARAASLQQQLDDLLGVTSQLSSALTSYESQVSVDGLTARQLRERLKASEARLKLINRLLKEANDRLRQLGAAAKTPPPVAGGSSGGGSGGGTAGSGAGSGGGSNPNPTPTAAGFHLTLSLSGSDVRVDWTTCTASGFSAYAIVRSRDSEIHYPAEDLDTVIARVTSASSTALTDAAAPSGQSWYRIWCLTRSGGEERTAATTNTVGIAVP
jgi:hypothetical protein